ncbi:MAG: phage portal protein [Planctomycetota bacterium]|nr:phage portal protein [Planctomycetota bacterium]
MFSRLKSFLAGRPAVRAGRRLLRFLRARYDAALTSDNNRRHWANADGLSANAANSPGVRRVLRNRSRYEVANNSYARGIVLTLANDCVGTGPRLQMLSPDRVANSLVEREFWRWAVSVSLAEKLRTMRMAKTEDGEAFALLTSNPALASPVSLDLKLVEADQVTTPDLSFRTRRAVDGIILDDFGNPVEYHVLKEHPGESSLRFALAYDRIPAKDILHYFRVDRPGQNRGVPELTPALPLFAMLRDYTLATLDAAKAAAYFAGVLYTDAPPNGEADSIEPMDTIELERNMLLTMPGGWKMGQVHAEQPASTYAEFKHEILNEIARCLNMPFNVAAGNSSGYNYASGRLDHQVYFKAIRVEQSYIGSCLLDRIFAAWVAEAVLVEDFLPQSLRLSSADWSHQWFWDGQEHVDPLKEASAQATRLQNHTTTLADEYARRGRDWEAELRQRAKEAALMQELGLQPAAALPAPVPVEETENAPPQDD